MSHSHRPYLRTLRRRWAFTQTELAFLAGFGSSAVVSRIENGHRIPELSSAQACELIFGLPLTDIFCAPNVDAAKGVLERARLLYDELQGQPGPENKLKLDFLEGLLARLEGTTTDHV